MPEKLPYILGGLAVVAIGGGTAWWLTHRKSASAALPAKPMGASPSPQQPSVAPQPMPGTIPGMPTMPGGIPAMPGGALPGGGLPPSPYQIPPSAPADLLAMAQNLAKNVQQQKSSGMGNRWSGPGRDYMGNHR